MSREDLSSEQTPLRKAISTSQARKRAHPAHPTRSEFVVSTTFTLPNASSHLPFTSCTCFDQKIKVDLGRAREFGNTSDDVSIVGGYRMKRDRG